MKTSAGLVPFRRRADGFEVLIAHPGGPLWKDKEAGAWSVIKGELDPGEDPQVAARREFGEETGWEPPPGKLIGLGEVTQRSGKRVLAYAIEADFDPTVLEPGTFTMRWRGRPAEFPEIDRVAWCSPSEARRLLNPAQAPFVDRLAEHLNA